jgi:hypothetical protein
MHWKYDFAIPDRAHTCIGDQGIGNPKDVRALTSKTTKHRNPDKVTQGHDYGGGHVDQARSKGANGKGPIGKVEHKIPIGKYVATVL